MTKPNVVSLKAITPPRWEGEVTDYMLEMIVKGLLVPNVETSRRLAYELMKAWAPKKANQPFVRRYMSYYRPVGGQEEFPLSSRPMYGSFANEEEYAAKLKEEEEIWDRHEAKRHAAIREGGRP